MFKKIYENLCKKGQLIERVELYGPGSNLHKHHIIPIHSGGSDNIENFTYLSIREHIIAHFLLYKIFKNPNDLRSMNMLGANLNYKQRRTVGKWCFENKIGMFSENYTEEDRRLWNTKGANSQINNGWGIHTFDKEKRKEWAQMGGKAGAKIQIEKCLGIHTDDKEKRKEWSRMGGLVGSQKIKDYIFVYNERTDHSTKIPPNLFDEYISRGYRRGRRPRHLKITRTYATKEVIINNKTYSCVKHAALLLNMKESQVRSRCCSKSKKHSAWNFGKTNYVEKTINCN
jgi:hypothetical protein